MIEINQKDFDRKLEKFLDQVRATVELGCVDLALEARKVLAERTPALSGSARASWNATSGYVNAEYKDKKEYFNPEGAVNDGQLEMAGHQIGVPIFVSNSVPYILDLENGSSQQAPAGMMGPGLIEVAQEALAILTLAKQKAAGI